MTVFIRIALAILLLDELVVGAWNAIWPEGFYRYFPTVDLTPPFSEHYARDFGGATLGIALLLCIALFKPKAHFAIPAALAFSIFSVPHFFYHVSHLEGATIGEAIALTIANAVVALLGIAIILGTIVRDRRADGEGIDTTSARPSVVLGIRRTARRPRPHHIRAPPLRARRRELLQGSVWTTSRDPCPANVLLNARASCCFAAKIPWLSTWMIKTSQRSMTSDIPSLDGVAPCLRVTAKPMRQSTRSGNGIPEVVKSLD